MIKEEVTNLSNNISFPEKVITYYLKKAGLEVEENVLLENKVANLKHLCNKKSLDCYFEINNKKFAVEYDGVYFHQNTQDIDLLKNKICSKNRIHIIRIRENGLSPLDNLSYDYILRKNKNIDELKNAIIFIMDILYRIYKIKLVVDIDIKRDMNEIQKSLFYKKEYNSISNVRPDLAKEWNYEKNAMTPDCMTFRSHQLVWWKCSKGHEWQARPLNRYNGNGCPVCANRKLLKGYNDFKTLHPELIKYWHPENVIKPTEIMGKSDKEILWLCPKCNNAFYNKAYKFVSKKTKCSCCKDKGI